MSRRMLLMTAWVNDRTEDANRLENNLVKPKEMQLMKSKTILTDEQSTLTEYEKKRN